MSTEDRPHVVYPKQLSDRDSLAGMTWQCAARVYPSYTEAFYRWRMIHSHSDPHVIGVISRVIEPETPIIDPNE